MNSIYHFKNKIKGLQTGNRNLILNILVIILVSVGSFFLGRMSNSKLSNEKAYIVNGGEEGSQKVTLYPKSSKITSLDSSTQVENRYVASKNGKLYYRVGCGSSSRIKEENKVFFDSTQSAEQAGFQASESCTP